MRGLVTSFLFATVSRAFIPIHRYGGRRWADATTSAKGSRREMVRNIDLVEALVFYGSDAIAESCPEGTDGSIRLLPGIDNLLGQCKRDETAVLFLWDKTTDNGTEPDVQSLENALSKAGHGSGSKDSLRYVVATTCPPPNPRDLWTALNDITIVPKGFGGSSGFGRKIYADPERAPLPKHTVVLTSTEDQCRAARYIGARVLCLTYTSLADAVLDMDGDWSSLTMDDIATPGSFWLNPPHPRDDSSNSVDPEQVIENFERLSDDDDSSSELDSPAVEQNDEMTDDELAAILADMDPL